MGEEKQNLVTVPVRWYIAQGIPCTERICFGPRVTFLSPHWGTRDASGALVKCHAPFSIKIEFGDSYDGDPRLKGKSGLVTGLKSDGKPREEKSDTEQSWKKFAHMVAILYLLHSVEGVEMVGVEIAEERRKYKADVVKWEDYQCPEYCENGEWWHLVFVYHM